MKPFDFARMWIPEWSPLEVAVRAAIIYLFVQILFRLAGRKELARYSTSDVALLFLVSTAARKSIVGEDSSLTAAMVALATIVGLDVLFSWLSFRSRRVADVVEGPPRKLVHGGRVDEEELRRTRISRDELVAHLRGHGRTRLEDVEEAYLERSGKITFVFREAERG
jgi:uncharacterized membrane protein YcaP (DUF421 family)